MNQKTVSVGLDFSEEAKARNVRVFNERVVLVDTWSRFLCFGGVLPSHLGCCAAEGVMPGAVGKRELLAWAADTSELPCSRLEDLKSGVVLLALLYKIFPKLIDRKLRMRWAPKFDHEQTMNWDAIEHAIALLRLPSELFDREGLQACRFRPTYNLLVAVYFLQQVAQSSDFTADFSHPIEPSLASFLQSRSAVETMIAGGAIAPPPEASSTLMVLPAPPPSKDEGAHGPATPEPVHTAPVPMHLFIPASTPPPSSLGTPDVTALAAVAASLLDEPPARASDSTAHAKARRSSPPSRAENGGGHNAPRRWTPSPARSSTQGPLTRRASTDAAPSPGVGLGGARPLYSAATNVHERALPRATTPRREQKMRGAPSTWATESTSSAGQELVTSHTLDRKALQRAEAPRSDAEAIALMDTRFELRRLEALLSTKTAELHACRRLHRIELDAARAELTQQQRKHGEYAATAAAAAEATIAEARSQCRMQLTAELERLEAEVLDAYAAELGDPADPALPPTEGERANLFLRRMISIQSKQVSELHAELAEMHVRLRHERAEARPATELGAIVADASPVDAASAAIVSQEAEVWHWKNQAEALRLTLARTMQQKSLVKDSLATQAPHVSSTHAPSTQQALLQQNAMLRRAADFLRRRHRQMLLAPAAWIDKSALAAADEAAAQAGGYLASEDANHEDDEADKLIDALNSTGNIEARAASLMGELLHGKRQDDAAVIGSFWQLVIAFCVEERRRRLLTLRMRELKRQHASEMREQVAVLADERMRARRAELALENAVAEERGLASRTQAGLHVALALARARADEYSLAQQAAEARHSEASRSLQASHSTGWRATQRKLCALESEVRRLRTRETMWGQLCERQRVLARALRAGTSNDAGAKAGHASSVAQIEAEVAAWEQSMLGSQAARSASPFDGAPLDDNAAPGSELEVLHRVDEATAALSAEVVTLRSELSACRSRQTELAEAGARADAERTSAFEQLKHAHARCEALHHTTQRVLERLKELETEAVLQTEMVHDTTKSADALRWAQLLKREEDTLRSRLQEFHHTVHFESAYTAAVVDEEWPSRPPKTCIYVENTEEGVDENVVEGDAGGEEFDALLPDRQWSSRSAAAAIYVDEGTEEPSVGQSLSSRPAADPNDVDERTDRGTSDHTQEEAAVAIREVCGTIVVEGVARGVKFEVSKSDTPSSLALELMDALQVSHTGQTTLRDLVHQIESLLMKT